MHQPRATRRPAARLAAVLLAAAASAATARAGVINVPGDLPTLADAIAAALPGDEILLAAGTFTGEGNIPLVIPGDADLTIRGAGPLLTTIDGAEEATVITVEGSQTPATIVLADLTLANGRGGPTPGSGGGGLRVVAGSGNQTLVRVENVRFTDCSAGVGGGALVFPFARAEFTGCEFVRCTAENLGGGGLATFAVGTTTVAGCTFEECTARDTEGGPPRVFGGGLLARRMGGSTTVTGSTFRGCVANDGGAIAVQGATPSLIGGEPSAAATMTGCTFENNAAVASLTGQFGVGNGGAIDVRNAALATVSQCEFTANTAEFAGGAIDTFAASIVLVDESDFRDNSAVITAGAIATGQDANAPAPGRTEITGCLFLSNTTPGTGGALGLFGAGELVSGCGFAANTAGEIGGAADLLLARIEGCVFQLDDAPAASAFVLRDSTAAGNTLLSGTVLAAGTSEIASGMHNGVDVEGELRVSGGSFGSFVASQAPAPAEITFVARSAQRNGVPIPLPFGQPAEFTADQDAVLDITLADGRSLAFTLNAEPIPGDDFLGNGLVRLESAACNPADLDRDGTLTFADVTAFIDAFNAGDPEADTNADGLVNFGDVTAFVEGFNTGCP